MHLLCRGEHIFIYGKGSLPLLISVLVLKLTILAVNRVALLTLRSFDEQLIVILIWHFSFGLGNGK